MRRLRLCIIAYCMFDLFIGGYNGGLLPLMPISASQVPYQTCSVFKSVTVNATASGNSAAWTPAAGKRFHLLNYQITAQGLAATAAAAVTVSFQDATTALPINYDVAVPAIASLVPGVTAISGGSINLGAGILSATANNVLNFNISAAGAGTVGTYRINACGTEE